MTKEEVNKLKDEIASLDARGVLAWALNKFGLKNMALASSLGAEDQVLTDMLLKLNPQASIFTLDTGRLANETYDLIEATNKKYGIKLEILFPDNAAVEKMVKEHGPNLFYESIENRKLCCQVRKVAPLRRKLKTLKAWITGLRQAQALTRSDLQLIEWDENNGLVKINPLARWTEEDVWKYIKQNNVPYNKLHDAGYPSIGCAPCTRAIDSNEDIRAGRWWWEAPLQKECGLHLKTRKEK